MTLSRKHGQSMVEDITPTLHPLVQPLRAMPLFIQINGKRLSATVVNCVNEGNVEVVRVLREVVCAGHACKGRLVRYHQYNQPWF